MKRNIAIAVLTGTTMLAGPAQVARAQTPPLSEVMAQLDPETAKILEMELRSVGAFYAAAPAPAQQEARAPETTGGAFVDWLRKKIDIPEKPEKPEPRARAQSAPEAATKPDAAAQAAQKEEKPDAMKLVNWLRDKIDAAAPDKTAPIEKPAPAKTGRKEPAAPETQSAQQAEKPDAMELVGWLRGKITGAESAGKQQAPDAQPQRRGVVVESPDVIFRSPRQDDAVESMPLPEPEIARKPVKPAPKSAAPVAEVDMTFIDAIAMMYEDADAVPVKTAPVKQPRPLPEKTITESLLGWLPDRDGGADAAPRSAVTRTKLAAAQARSSTEPPGGKKTPAPDAEEHAMPDGTNSLFDDAAKVETVVDDVASAQHPETPVKAQAAAKTEEAAETSLTGGFIDWLMKRRESSTPGTARTSGAKPDAKQRNASVKVEQAAPPARTAETVQAAPENVAPSARTVPDETLPDPELPPYRSAGAPSLDLQMVESFDYDPPAPLAKNDGTEKGIEFHLPPYPENAVAVMGAMSQHTVGERDTLQDIARNHGLGYVEMLAANPGVDPWTPLPGTKVTVPTRKLLPRAPQEGIVVNLAEMRMYHFHSKSQPPRTYPLGIGREGLQTPTGATTVVRKKIGPSWYPTERMREENPALPKVVKAGPANPLGTHALYLGWPTFLIHGTSRPWGVGRRISSGCIRMYPEHIPVLFESVPVGTPVNIVNQTIKLAWLEDGLYLEALPSAAQSVQLEMSEDVEFAPTPDWLKHEIIKMSGKKAGSVNWKLAHDTVIARRGVPVRILDRYAPDAKLETPVAELMKDDVQPQKKEQTASSEDTGSSDGRGPAFDYNP